MYDATDYVGRRGLMMHAIGGIDLALWDLYGKIQGKPVHAADRRRAARQASRIWHDLSHRAHAGRREGAGATPAKQLNLRSFKLAPTRGGWRIWSSPPRLLQAAREEAGPEAKIIVDAALSYRTAEEGCG